MAQNKINKLELTWIGKEDEPLAIEPRLLIDTPEYSFGEVETGVLPNGKTMAGQYAHSRRQSSRTPRTRRKLYKCR